MNLKSIVSAIALSSSLFSTVGSIGLPTCTEEDSSNCRWSASTSGLANGGDSFTAVTDSHGLVWRYYDNRTVSVSAPDDMPVCNATGIAPVPCQSTDGTFFVVPSGDPSGVLVISSNGEIEPFAA